MKKILLLIAIFTLGESQAQQVSLNSQYMFNYFAINPAVAGTKNYSPITFSFRRQWMGINDAPVTQSYDGSYVFWREIRNRSACI